MESHKGEHKVKDSLSGSGLRAGSGGNVNAMNVLNSLLVLVQNEDHGATRSDHEHGKYNFGKYKQCCI